MPTTEQKELILELRSQGRTYNDIAYILGVSRRTLFYWKEELQGELAWEEEADYEALRHQLLGSRASQVHRLAERLDAVNAELDKRSMADLSTSRLMTLAESLRRQILKATTPRKLMPQRRHDQLPDPVVPPSIHESTNPPTQPSEQCNDSAKMVQTPADACPPIRESTNPSIEPSGQCNESAKIVQPASEPSRSIIDSNNPSVQSVEHDGAETVQSPPEPCPSIHSIHP